MRKNDNPAVCNVDCSGTVGSGGFLQLLCRGGAMGMGWAIAWMMASATGAEPGEEAAVARALTERVKIAEALLGAILTWPRTGVSLTNQGLTASRANRRRLAWPGCRGQWTSPWIAGRAMLLAWSWTPHVSG